MRVYYRSLVDMAGVISSEFARLPKDVDVVIGIPRSGIAPAAMIALLMNRPLADLDGFLDGRVMGHGRTRQPVNYSADASSYARLLLVDDSVGAGVSMQQAKQRIALAFPNAEILCLSVYLHNEQAKQFVDVHLAMGGRAPVFEWSLMHCWIMARACVDLEGVICRDPTDLEEDDGPRYREFVETVPGLAIPTWRVRRIVTTRREKYRHQTEEWLRNAGVEYDYLDMLDLPNIVERKKAGIYARFKAEVYRSDRRTYVFVESDPEQAGEVARLSGKRVLDFAHQRLIEPTALSAAYYREQAFRLGGWTKRQLVRRLFARNLQTG